MLAWCIERTHWHCKKCNCRTHGRNEHGPRIFAATGGLVCRRCDWVRPFVLLTLNISTDLPNSFSSLIGGVLSRPQDRWPHIFSHPFWAVYPYFLPCLVAAAFTFMSFVITALCLEEVCCFLLIEENRAMTLSDVEFEALKEGPACRE